MIEADEAVQSEFWVAELHVYAAFIDAWENLETQAARFMERVPFLRWMATNQTIQHTTCACYTDGPCNTSACLSEILTATQGMVYAVHGLAVQQECLFQRNQSDTQGMAQSMKIQRNGLEVLLVAVGAPRCHWQTL